MSLVTVKRRIQGGEVGKGTAQAGTGPVTGAAVGGRQAENGQAEGLAPAQTSFMTPKFPVLDRDPESVLT